MELMKARWIILLVLTVGLTFPGAAAETQPDLQCNVTRRPDGSTLYRVSTPRWSNRCRREWLDQNKTVFARDADTDPNHVLNVTETSITLRVCQDVLLHKRDCREGHEEAFCTVNCSGLLVESQPSTVNSTLICFSESLCLPALTVRIVIIVIIVVIVIIALVVGVSVHLCDCKRRRQEATTHMAEYSVVDDVIKV